MGDEDMRREGRPDTGAKREEGEGISMTFRG